MTRITWDAPGEHYYETGVDHGVLYLPDSGGDYSQGYGWNGLITVTESPTGAEAMPLYADNIKYLNLVSAEEFGATIEAYTYPPEFEKADGSRSPSAGITVGQQTRIPFGFCYRSLKGNDTLGTDLGYKLHLVYNALAAPSEKARGTVNETPEAVTFSWTITTTPIAIPGVDIDGNPFKPSARISLDSTIVDADALAELEDILYGTVGVDPRLPLPEEVFALFAGAITVATPTAPTYNSTTKVITIPSITGVVYKMDGETLASGAQPAITEDKLVSAVPAPGYVFPDVIDTDWFFDF